MLSGAALHFEAGDLSRAKSWSNKGCRRLSASPFAPRGFGCRRNCEAGEVPSAKQPSWPLRPWRWWAQSCP